MDKQPEMQDETGPQRDAQGRFKPGSSGNRKRGPGKAAIEVRTMLKEALGELGGVEYLKRAAREHPTAFLGLLGRLIPSEIKASLDTDGVPVVLIRDFTGGHGRADAPSDGPAVVIEPVGHRQAVESVTAADVEAPVDAEEHEKQPDRQPPVPGLVDSYLPRLPLSPSEQRREDERWGDDDWKEV